VLFLCDVALGCPCLIGIICTDYRTDAGVRGRLENAQHSNTKLTAQISIHTTVAENVNGLHFITAPVMQMERAQGKCHTSYSQFRYGSSDHFTDSLRQMAKKARTKMAQDRRRRHMVNTAIRRGRQLGASSAAQCV